MSIGRAVIAALAGLLLGACGVNQSVSFDKGPGLKAEPTPATDPPVFSYALGTRSRLVVPPTPHVTSIRDAVDRVCPGASPALLAALHADREAIDWTKGPFHYGRFVLLGAVTGEVSYTGLASETVEAASMTAAMVERARLSGANLLVTHKTRVKIEQGSQFTKHQGELEAQAFAVRCDEPGDEPQVKPAP